jgi:hypothetical protein
MAARHSNMTGAVVETRTEISPTTPVIDLRHRPYTADLHTVRLF